MLCKTEKASTFPKWKMENGVLSDVLSVRVENGYKKIPEPAGDTDRYLFEPEHADKTLLLMPGSAFDPLGNRMGYGGGFYDRYLADKENLRLRSIGIGFHCQQVEQVPVEVTDVKPYQVILV